METMKIKAIKIGDRFRHDLRNLDQLRISICENGLLHPVVVTNKGELIAGLRRLKACEALGWQEIPVVVVDPNNPRKAEADENRVRCDFTVSEAVAVDEYFMRIEEPQAAERKKEGKSSDGASGGRGKRKPSAKFAEGLCGSGGGEARAKAAEATGFSHEKLRQAQVVLKAAKKDPEKFQSVADEMEKTGKVNPAYKQVMLAKNVAKPIRKKRKWAGEDLLLKSIQDAYLFLPPETKQAFRKWLETVE